MYIDKKLKIMIIAFNPFSMGFYLIRSKFIVNLIVLCKHITAQLCYNFHEIWFKFLRKNMIYVNYRKGEDMEQNDANNLSLRNMLILTGFLGVLLVASMFIYGPRVLAIAAVSYGVSFVIEFSFTKLRNQSLDNAWMVTPMIFALLVPPNAPLWMAGIGAGFAVFFGKMIFGGLGKTVFNPALVGIIFVTVSFIPFMTTQWLDPQTGEITPTTPMVAYNDGYQNVTESWSFSELLLGTVPGMVGTTFMIGILALGIGLLILKIADWRITLSVLASYAVIQGLYSFGSELAGGEAFGNAIEYMFINTFYGFFVGSLLFAAFFVATDPVTAPEGNRGKFIFGFGIALLTVIIRVFSAFPEGIVFAIILMNAITPHIDAYYENKIQRTSNTKVETQEVSS